MRRLITTFWWIFVGIPWLLVISLCLLYSHWMERQHRHEVMTHGVQTTARIIRSSSIESVRVTWADSGGRAEMADAWTGKPFARMARAGQDVAIKYVPESMLDPVILSEAAERDRVNEWGIKSSAGVALIMTTICVLIGGVVLTAKYRIRA